jgi:hypothetical protein
MLADGNVLLAKEYLERNITILECIEMLKFQLSKMQLYSVPYTLSQIFGEKKNTNSAEPSLPIDVIKEQSKLITREANKRMRKS